MDPVDPVASGASWRWDELLPAAFSGIVALGIPLEACRFGSSEESLTGMRVSNYSPNWMGISWNCGSVLTPEYSWRR